MQKYIFLVFFLLSTCMLHTNAAPSSTEKQVAKNIIIDTIKNQIKKLISYIESIVKKAIEELVEIEHKVGDITEGAIKLATDAINAVIDGAIDSVRKIAEDAIDAGINITECYVGSVDDLNIIRRELLADEVACATSQMNEFNAIINMAVKNFTEDIKVIGALPKRLQDCLTSLNAIQCVADLVTDVTGLQQEIPQQVLDTMLAISDYMTGFGKRVHKCQFDQLREAVDLSREVIDRVRYCAREMENSTQAIPQY